MFTIEHTTDVGSEHAPHGPELHTTIRIGHTTTIEIPGTDPLPRAEAALLVLLVGLGRPVPRRELAQAAAISERTLRPVLSRLPRRLGLDGPLHDVVGGRSGRIALRPGVLDTQVVLAVGEEAFALGDLGVVAGHPLVREACARLAASAAEPDAGPAMVARTTTRRPPQHEEFDAARTAELSAALESAVDDLDLLTATRHLLGVLGVACSGGEVVDASLASALSPSAMVDAERLVAHPSLAGLVARTPRGDLAFRDGPTAGAALAMLPPSQRRSAHLVAVGHLDRRPATLTSLALLGHHARRCGDAPTAASALTTIVDAARAATARGEHREAASLLEVALSLSDDDATTADLALATAEALARDLPWSSAIEVVRVGVAAARHLGDGTRLGKLALRLGRLTWDPATGAETDALLAESRDLIGETDPPLAARLDLCRAGGAYQDGAAGTLRVPAARVHSALAVVPSLVDPLERAWGRIHGRKALLAVIEPGASLALADAALADAGGDPAVAAHAHQARFVDLLRLDRRAAARRELAALERLGATPQSAEQEFGVLSARICWDLAMGRWDRAVADVVDERRVGASLPGATASQVVTAHEVWLAIGRGHSDELAALVPAARQLAAGDDGPGSVLWSCGEALLALAVGDVEAAVVALSPTRAVEMVPGPHRLPALSIAALVTATAVDAGQIPAAGDDAVALAAALEAAPESGVLIGWPTLHLGPTDRFRGLAELAAGRHLEARRRLDAALHADRWSPAHLAASLRARAMLGRTLGDGSEEVLLARAAAIERGLAPRLDRAGG